MIQEADQVIHAWKQSPVARIQPAEVILVTDFDGTLAEIVQDPAGAGARPEALAALEELVRLLVDRPEAVDLAVVPQRDATLLELSVDPEDLGKVIGRQGRTASALRTLLDTRGDRDGVRYELEILED